MKYFIDTYGLLEIAMGNKTFEIYLNHDILTLKSNLAELYYILSLKYNEKTAQHFCRHFSKLVFDFPPEIVQKAMHLRLKYKKRKWSYTDSIGYAFALDTKRIFLTGDRGFLRVRVRKNPAG